MLGLAGNYGTLSLTLCSVHMPLKMEYIITSGGFIKRMVLFCAVLRTQVCNFLLTVHASCLRLRAKLASKQAHKTKMSICLFLRRRDIRFQCMLNLII